MMTPKLLLRRLARRAYDFARHESLPAMSHPGLVTGLDQASVRITARLAVDDPEVGPGPRIVLGRGAYVGERVLLVASREGTIQVGEEASLQDDCMVGGDVQIGAHCLFGKYVFLSSTKHRFMDRPAWLIRDQDRMAHVDPALKSALSSRIVIEDDCWIGQSVVINPGIEIGRGAVIGANSVVTADVAPYEIHGGVPARRIGRRLDFHPPTAIQALEDDHIPYFYRGFCLSRDALAASRAEGVVNASDAAWLVLPNSKTGHIVLQGRCASGMQLDVAINGMSCGVYSCDGTIDIRVSIPTGRMIVRKALQDFTLVQITPRLPGSYGISSAVLEDM